VDLHETHLILFVILSTVGQRRKTLNLFFVYFLTPKVSSDISSFFYVFRLFFIFYGGSDLISPKLTIFINTSIFKDVLKDLKC